MTCAELHKLLLAEGAFFGFNKKHEKYGYLQQPPTNVSVDDLFVAYDHKNRQILNCQLQDNWDKMVFTDGIYIMFQNEELGNFHDDNLPAHDRIVYVGINEENSEKQIEGGVFKLSGKYAKLRRRLKDHFAGTRTTSLRRHLEASLQKANISTSVSEYIQENFYFVVIHVPNKDLRDKLEGNIISTVAHCKHCIPTSKWIGKHNPIQKIANGNLWNVNKLNDPPLDDEDLAYIKAHLVRESDLPKKP